MIPVLYHGVIELMDTKRPKTAQNRQNRATARFHEVWRDDDFQCEIEFVESFMGDYRWSVTYMPTGYGVGGWQNAIFDANEQIHKTIEDWFDQDPQDWQEE